MLNFAEQTGSGAVMLVWSFPQLDEPDLPTISQGCLFQNLSPRTDLCCGLWASLRTGTGSLGYRSREDENHHRSVHPDNGRLHTIKTGQDKIHTDD